jgi:hypothetical protein
MKNQNTGRTYIPLSFSCPPELEIAIQKRCADLDLNRSEYLRKLFVEETTINPLGTPKENTYAGLIRTIARQLAGYHPQDRRALVEAALIEAAKHDAYQVNAIQNCIDRSGPYSNPID